MEVSICHYSFHRTWKEENWDCEWLAREVKNLGCGAIDFHAGLLGAAQGAAQKIKDALEATGLTLSGLSLSNNFNQEDPAALAAQVQTVKEWLEVAAEVKAPVSRIFGGHIKDRRNPDLLKQGFDRILKGLGLVTAAAEKAGVVLALENHGGLPCTGEEQVSVLKQVNSPFLKATVDVGNYMSGGQEGHRGTELAADRAAYVHFKDFKKLPPKDPGLPWSLAACTVGQGDVNLYACLEELYKAGYTGFVAIEYEGPDMERTGVPRSLAYTKKLLAKF